MLGSNRFNVNRISSPPEHQAVVPKATVYRSPSMASDWPKSTETSPIGFGTRSNLLSSSPLASPESIGHQAYQQWISGKYPTSHSPVSSNVQSPTRQDERHAELRMLQQLSQHMQTKLDTLWQSESGDKSNRIISLLDDWTRVDRRIAEISKALTEECLSKSHLTLSHAHSADVSFLQSKETLEDGTKTIRQHRPIEIRPIEKETIATATNNSTVSEDFNRTVFRVSPPNLKQENQPNPDFKQTLGTRDLLSQLSRTLPESESAEQRQKQVLNALKTNVPDINEIPKSSGSFVDSWRGASLTSRPTTRHSEAVKLSDLENLSISASPIAEDDDDEAIDKLRRRLSEAIREAEQLDPLKIIDKHEAKELDTQTLGRHFESFLRKRGLEKRIVRTHGMFHPL